MLLGAGGGLLGFCNGKINLQWSPGTGGEMLMGQAIKVDNIVAERDAVAQKSLQNSLVYGFLGKRVEKCVETLDMLKISNGRAEPVAITTQPSRRPLILHQCHATMELFD
ncbi:hypothetical protein GOBAR_DD10315 [Gossypium barbadense]|nr:hypothetical protein GOBAR_DD10315 [Gossypium barbadense]